ncbi:MAG: NAD(P)-dependent oxidoreductase [Planctomycetota bacterium]
MPDRPLVLVTETLDRRCADWLAERCEIAWVRFDDPSFNGRLHQADALVVRTYTQVNQALLDQAPQLKVVGRAGVGLDNFDLPACQARGVQVVYTPDANTQAVVEYVLGLMLDHFRPRAVLPPGAPADVFHEMRKTEVGRQLSDMTLGIVGMGRIGTRLAVVAHKLGVNVHATDILPEPQIRKRCPGVPFEFLPHAELYAGSDIVTLHADGRPDNRGMINADALQAIRPHTLLLNAARGMLVDETALHAWLSANPQAHAMLDVHDPEPPAPDAPLHDLPNCTLLPHLASRTDTALLNMSWVVRDVADVLEGLEPRYPAPKD